MTAGYKVSVQNLVVFYAGTLGESVSCIVSVENAVFTKAEHTLTLWSSSFFYVYIQWEHVHMGNKSHMQKFVAAWFELIFRNNPNVHQ